MNFGCVRVEPVGRVCLQVRVGVVKQNNFRTKKEKKMIILASLCFQCELAFNRQQNNNERFILFIIGACTFFSIIRQKTFFSPTF